MSSHNPRTRANDGGACPRRLDYEGSREATIRSLIDPSGLCLEIGPSYNPILPKSSGFNVITVDHLDAPRLRMKYAKAGNIDASKIEEVDLVWNGEPLSEFVGESRFDLVVASHVIEHIPDMLRFLQECEKALKKTGHLLLVVPDRRKCFDYFRPFSTTGAILQAHFEKRKRHLPGMAFDFVANFASLDHPTGDRPAESFRLANSVASARGLFDSVADSHDYIDLHAWVFTPSSFRLIISDLNAIGALQIREQQIWETQVFEFIAVLGREGSGCPHSRADLLVSCQKEAAASSPPVPAGDLAGAP